MWAKLDIILLDANHPIAYRLLFFSRLFQGDIAAMLKAGIVFLCALQSEGTTSVAVNLITLTNHE
jgi:hypothetical protein